VKVIMPNFKSLPNCTVCNSAFHRASDKHKLSMKALIQLFQTKRVVVDYRNCFVCSTCEKKPILE